MPEIRRVAFGTIVRPGAETPDGRARVERLSGFLVALPAGWLLFDTGIAVGHPEIDEHYRCMRVPLDTALASAGVARADVRMIANCHLHVDHAGGNPAFAGVPVLAQRAELDAAEDPDHTFPELLAASRFEVLDGDAAVRPGVRVLATPGHTPGHQSLLVDTEAGPVLLAGQTHDTASAFTADALAVERPGEDVPQPPAWLPALLSAGLVEARFAHDTAVWRPSGATGRAPASRPGLGSRPSAR